MQNIVQRSNNLNPANAALLTEFASVGPKGYFELMQQPNALPRAR
jgi:hypothetical protein